MESESQGAKTDGRGRHNPERLRYQQAFVIALVFTLAALVVLIYKDWSSYSYFRLTVLPESSMTETVGIIVHLDEALTMSARLNAATGDTQWEQRYRTLEPQLDSAIQRVKRAAPNIFIGEIARQTDEANIALVKMEHQAFELVHQGRRLAAEALLASPEYMAQKQAYARGFHQIRTALRERDAEHLATMRRELYLSLIFTLVVFPLLMLAWSMVLRVIRKHDTERQRAEEALSSERNLLRTLIDSLPDSVCVYIKDSKSRYVINNLAHLRSLGASRQEDVVGKTSFDFFPREYAEAYLADEQEVIRTGEALADKEELVHNRALGEIRWHITTKVPLRDLTGTNVGLVGMSSDITLRKQMEERLRENEERFRALYENSTIGLYRTTPDGEVLLANQSLLKMLGYSSFEELAARNLDKDGFEPSYERKHFVEQIEIEGEVKGWESAWTRRDGSVVYVRESARVIRDSNGNTLYYDGTVEDITERKRVEGERELLVTKLKDALDNVKTLSGLVPICAHCKKIRDDKGYWNQLERYLVEHTDASLTHGICPECARLYFPGSNVQLS
jgi:PAS domain S-box-containing protein